MVVSIEDDKAAVLEALEEETNAFLRRDIEAMSALWVQSAQSRRIVSVASLGVQVYEGWDAIRLNYLRLMEELEKDHPSDCVVRTNFNVVVIGDMAWVSHEEAGTLKMSGHMQLLKVFHRVIERWKLACIVVIQRIVDLVASPTIELDSSRKVLWMNVAAHEQINSHNGLTVSGGRLRALSRSHDNHLKEAVDWASGQKQTHWPLAPFNRHARAVILGENENGAPMFCWVLVQDGKILVSFNDNELVKHRVEIAQSVYGFSAAQIELSQHLAAGRDLAAAADIMGVSINTIRTHLQRMFDKTGMRSQSALICVLLSAEAPTAR
jgi:DNA-binding CsgD family transcriptional regulator